MISVFIFSSSFLLFCFCHFLGKTRFEGINMLTCCFHWTPPKKSDVWDVSRTMAVVVVVEVHHVVIFVSFRFSVVWPCWHQSWLVVVVNSLGWAFTGKKEWAIFAAAVDERVCTLNYLICYRSWFLSFCFGSDTTQTLSYYLLMLLSYTAVVQLYSLTNTQIQRQKKDITRCCAMQTI